MNTNKFHSTILPRVTKHFVAFGLVSLPLVVLAADFGLQNPIKVNSISELILIVARVVRYIAIPFVVIAIMYSGWLYIWEAYQSNAKNIQKAHDSLKYTIIGVFILLSAELIALVMRNTIEGLTR
jgi:hypothetical protein